MNDEPETAQVLIRPPLALVLAIIVGLVLDQFLPLGFFPASSAVSWLGMVIFFLGLALLIWAAVTIMKAGSNVPTNQPTTAIVSSGPYRVSRNPIYAGMFIGLIGLSIAFNTLWLLITLVCFALVIRYGVVAREEAYLDRKFGDDYRAYRSRVRRWL